MQNITPCLWFRGNAEEAVTFYTSVFKNGRITNTSRYGKGAPFPEGTLLVANFELDGLKVMALNGNASLPFSVATSMLVNCNGQQEVDHLWDKLTSDGGEPGQCGWLKDRFGFSWQIVPTALVPLMSSPDGAKASRVRQALMKMKKIDISELQKAYDGT